jgi:peptide/nickel transport system permease protein
MVNVIADQPAAPVRQAAAGPWRTAWRKLKADRSAIAAFGVLVVIVIASLAAPLYAQYIAHTDPFVTNLNGEIVIDGVTQPVLKPSTEGLGLGMTPIGPTWRIGPYLLGGP